jgi:hypothetical protein
LVRARLSHLDVLDFAPHVLVGDAPLFLHGLERVGVP